MERLDTLDIKEWIWDIRGKLRNDKHVNRPKLQRKLMTLENVYDKYEKLQIQNLKDR